MNQGQETRPNGVLQKRERERRVKVIFKFFWLYFYVSWSSLAVIVRKALTALSSESWESNGAREGLRRTGKRTTISSVQTNTWHWKGHWTKNHQFGIATMRSSPWPIYQSFPVIKTQSYKKCSKGKWRRPPNSSWCSSKGSSSSQKCTIL